MKILRTLLDRFALRCVECGSWGYKALDVGGLFISNHPEYPQIPPFDIWRRKICRHCGHVMVSKVVSTEPF